MPNYAVTISFGSRDALSASMKAMGANVEKFETKAAQSFNGASRAASRFKAVLGGILVARTIQYSIGTLSRTVQDLTSDFGDFDLAARGAAARFYALNPRASNFASILKQVQDVARQTGRTTIFTAAQAAQALDQMARAGLKPETAFRTIADAINLSVAAGEEFSSTSARAMMLMSSFALESRTPAIQAANFKRLTNVLASGVNKAQVTIEDLFETMKQAGPVSVAYKYSLEDTMALGIALGKAGLIGSQGATTLKNAMLRLGNPRVRKLLKEQKIAIEDLRTGKALPMVTILENMGRRLSRLKPIDRPALLNQIFGRYAVAGASRLIDTLQNVRELTDSLYDVEGVSDTMAALMSQAWPNKIKLFKSALWELGFQIIDAFEHKGRRGIDALTAAVQRFDTKSIVEGLRTTGMILKGVFAVARPFLWLLPYIVGYMVSLSIATSMLSFREMIKGLVLVGMKAYSTGGAMAFLNAVMYANPAYLIAAAITGVVVVLIMLEKKFGIVSKAWGWMVNVFKAGVAFLVGAFRGFKLVAMDVFSFILDLVSKVGKFFGFNTMGIDKLVKSTRMARDELAKTYALEYKAREFMKSEAAQQATLPIHWGRSLTTQPPERAPEPPNRKEAEARKISFNGRLNIFGAPAGSTVENETSGAPAVDMRLMGVNP